MQELVKKLELVNPKIIDILKDGSIISGSSVLYYYMIEHNLQPNFVPDDIDIFCQYDTPGYYTVYNIFKDKKKSKFSTSCDNSEKFNTSLNGIARIKPLNLSNIIKCVRSYNFYYDTIDELNKKIKVDVIVLSENFFGTMMDFINKYFDFDFCKVYFDGNQICALYPESIYTRTFKLLHVPMTKFLVCSNEKKIIYRDLIRNFYMISDDHQLNDINDPSRTLRRLKKYKSRGFNILTDDFEIECDYGKDILRKLGLNGLSHTIQWRNTGPVICLENNRSYVDHDIIYTNMLYMMFNE